MLARLPAALAMAAIRFYRQHLSARKGYHCAWGRATGRDTCSGIGLRVIRRAGLIKGLALLRSQFDRCALASEGLRAAPARRRRMTMASQRGMVDADMDCGDCGGSHDGCSDCEPDATCNVLDCMSSADGLDDVAVAPCGSSNSNSSTGCCGPRKRGSEARYAAAKARMQERQRGRDERRAKGDDTESEE